jgi:hypothetical protein
MRRSQARHGAARLIWAAAKRDVVLSQLLLHLLHGSSRALWCIHAQRTVAHDGMPGHNASNAQGLLGAPHGRVHVCQQTHKTFGNVLVLADSVLFWATREQLPLTAPVQHVHICKRTFDMGSGFLVSCIAPGRNQMLHPTACQSNEVISLSTPCKISQGKPRGQPLPAWGMGGLHAESPKAR